MSDGPLSGSDDPLGSHEGAEQIEPDVETLMGLVFDRCYGPEWVSGQEIEAIAKSADRRGRQWRDRGFCWDTKPPPSGKGPWPARIGRPATPEDIVVLARLYKQHAGEPEAEAIFKQVRKMWHRDGRRRLSTWTVAEAIEDLRRL